MDDMTIGAGATFVLPTRLQQFLPARRRSAEAEVPVDGTATVGHLLASLGVPKTEVGQLRLDGHPVDAAYRPRAGDRIVVAEPRWPQPTPTSPPRFVLDVHLGALARRMRLLGLDTAYDRTADDDALVETSLTEQRVLLTRDRGLLHRRALRWGAHVDHQTPDDQLLDVVERFAPPLRPLSRCPACNGMLAEVAKADVQALLPAGTRRTYEVFRRCSLCGKVYWRGAHADRLARIVDAASPRAEGSAAASRPGCGRPPRAT